MPDTTPVPVTPDYAGLGYVANPFPPIEESSTNPHWMRLVTHAASNALLSGVLRAGSSERSRPVVVTMSEDVPDYYHRVAQNVFLNRTAHDPDLSLIALNVPLDMMRLGTIRGTLAEVAELVAAVGLSFTVGAYFEHVLRTPDTGLPEYDAVGPDLTADALDAFEKEPEAAMERFFGSRAVVARTAPTIEEDDALHEVYLRQVALDQNPEEAQEAGGEESAPDDGDGPAPDPGASADDVVRAYLLALLRSDLSPVVARALEAHAMWGQSIVAQELKVTKAPRKTLTALLRLMSCRWKHIVVLYDRFDAWPMMEQPARMDVLAALTELRWIIGPYGVMGVVVAKDRMVEIEEQFAAGEQVEWSMPELAPLYAGEFGFNTDRVQRWLDSAAITGASAVRADGPELAPLVEACDDDIQTFALMAEVAFRNAAGRGSAIIDGEAVDAGLASVTPEDGI